MQRPRVIIADTDVSYIHPLQQKFIEEFFEEIDLELISDRSYFDSLFTVPQTADVLIVSEGLYDSNLQRHNIGSIFVMTEQPYEEDSTGDLKVTPVFKYTSIKEIFNEITGKSEALQINGKQKQGCRIILVDSASGGVGKTTLALGISMSLTRTYKRVLYINAARLQSFQRILSNQAPISAGSVYAKMANATQSIYNEIKHVIRKEQFSYLPPFKASLISVGLSYSIYEKIAVSAKKSEDYDYIVVDADTVFDDDKANLLGVADKVIIVTDQSAAAVFATNVLVENINGVNSEKYCFICNNFDKDGDNTLISPNLSLKFTVSDYVEHMDHYDFLRCDDFAKNPGIQRTAFLVM